MLSNEGRRQSTSGFATVRNQPTLLWRIRQPCSSSVKFESWAREVKQAVHLPSYAPPSSVPLHVLWWSGRRWSGIGQLQDSQASLFTFATKATVANYSVLLFLRSYLVCKSIKPSIWRHRYHSSCIGVNHSRQCSWLALRCILTWPIFPAIKLQVC